MPDAGTLQHQALEEPAIDPVCGMRVDRATAKHRFDHDHRTFFFCGARCREKFAAGPSAYLKPRAEPVATDAIYTCPMHPEVRQIGPGSCPLCGMALEPVTITAEPLENTELRDMTRRFWIGLALSAPIVVLDMSTLLSPPLSTWIQCAFATPVVLWAGLPFFLRAWASIVHRSLNMFSLIALGTGAAYFYSLAATLAPAWFPGEADVYFESAAVITVLVLLGQVLELRAREQTGGAVRALLNLAPKTAHRLTNDGADTEIPLSDISEGDRLRLRPGDRVPVDGTVLEGGGAVDESMVTGESMPIAKAAGDRLIGGTINGTGALIMRADTVGAGTVLARIAAMVAEAQRGKAPIQRIADTVSSWFVPVVLAVAAVTFAVWALLGPAPGLSHGLIAAVSVLIIACPCALGLATPMSVGVGLGEGARMGILIKSAEALERMEAVDTLVLDKTGTLTEGKPRVTAIVTAAGFEEADVLARAASLERSSEHPLAAAIVVVARERGLALSDVADFRSITGHGVTGTVDGISVAIGGEKLLANQNVALAQAAATLRTIGATTIFVSIGGAPAAVIAIADPIKSTTPAALDRLRAAGVRIVMASGDNPITAAAVAHALGIDEVHGDMTPEDKHRLVRALQAEGRVVAMAGDGVNDAPALAAADVGIAMGAGTEVAIESAAITLVKGDLAGIARARTLSRATMRNIRQNLAFAFAYNIIGIPVAAGVLYPVFGLLLSPTLAALAMSLSSVSVIGNALRLRGVRL